MLTYTLYKKNLFIYLLSVNVISTFIQCTPKNAEPTPNIWADTIFQKIYQHQENRNAEALTPYLGYRDAKYREKAALALASIQDTLFVDKLSIASLDRSPLVRKAVAYSLGQTRCLSGLEMLFNALPAEQNITVQAEQIKAIGKLAYPKSKKLLELFQLNKDILNNAWAEGLLYLTRHQKLNDTLIQKALILLEKTDNDETKIFLLYALKKAPEITKQHIWTIEKLQSIESNLEILRLMNEITNKPKKSDSLILNTTFIKEYNQSKIYKKVQLLKQLAPSEQSINFAWQKLKEKSKSLAEQSELAQYIFSNIIYLSDPEEFIRLCLESKDMALQSIAAYTIVAEKDQLKFLKYSDQLKRIALNLKLPQQIETFKDINKALVHLNQEAIDEKNYKKNQAIPWDEIKNIPQKQKALIETTQGNITIELYVNEAPMTVYNFVKLIDSGYYENKFFHRVVDHFVIQGGCPRGDGWGSLNWVQRSDFSNYLKYQPGSVGIASAGKDTEGVQFFITHSATPHLNGRYTIFAQVIEGQDIVKIIALGDQIVKISLL